MGLYDDSGSENGDSDGDEESINITQAELIVSYLRD